jgi:hypothetical protein
MTRTSRLVGTGIAAAIAVAILGFGSSTQAQPYGGGWGARGNWRADCPVYRAYGPGYMRTGRGYGRGYMRAGRGKGPGWGPGWRRGPGYGPGYGRNW